MSYCTSGFGAVVRANDTQLFHTFPCFSLSDNKNRMEEEASERNKPTQSPTAKFSWKVTTPEGKCGCGPCLSPSWLQWLRWPPIIIGYLWVSGVVIYMGSSYFGAVLPAIERRFGLSSSQSALLAVLQDLSATLIAVFISFYAERSSRPVVISLSLVMMAIGKLMLAMPHFLSEPLDPDALISGQLSTGSIR